MHHKDLYQAAAELLHSDYFYAAISRSVRKVSTQNKITLGVCWNKSISNFELIYNPDFLNSLSGDEKKFVLQHEFLHILLGHVTYRMPEKEAMLRWNFATDCAINSMLAQSLNVDITKGAHQNFLFPERFDLPPLKAAEWYFQSLPKEVGQTIIFCPGDGYGDHDGHPGGSDENGDDGQDVNGNSGRKGVGEEVLKEAARKILVDAAKNEAISNRWGSVSGKLKQELAKILFPKADWRAILRFFIQKSQRTGHRSTIKRVNKRYPYIHPGKRADRSAVIAIGFDQSGSMSDELCSKIYAELHALSRIATFYVIPFDHTVAEDEIFKWEKNKTFPPARVRCGGTSFECVTEYVNQHSGHFDGLVIITDLEAPKPGPCARQRMWMSFPQYVNPPYFQPDERLIVVED